MIGGRALSGVATAVLLTATACAGAPSGERVGELRVCAEKSFGSSAGECRRDERGEVLASPDVYCSIEFVHHNDEHFAVQMYFEGELVSSGEGAIERDSGSLWVGAGTSNNAYLPAGRWECRLAITDESLSASFRTGGKTGAAPLTQAACLTSEAGEGKCLTEAEASSFQHPRSVTCSSLIVGLAGRQVRISVLRDTQEIASYTTPVSQMNVQTAYGTIDPEVLEVNLAALPPGEYACRFAVGDTPSWEVSFTVTG